MSEQKPVFIHELRFPEKDEFSRRFNIVNDWYEIAQKEDTDAAWENFYQAKYCLEQGLPISEPVKPIEP
jgi:hypothetical protein